MTEITRGPQAAYEVMALMGSDATIAQAEAMRDELLFHGYDDFDQIGDIPAHEWEAMAEAAVKAASET